MTYIFAKGKLTKINHRKHNEKNSENLKIYYIHIYILCIKVNLSLQRNKGTSQY